MPILREKQKVCAICGNKFKSIFTTKISNGVKICKECTSLIRIDSLKLPYISLNEAKKLAEIGRENLETLKNFTITKEALAVDYRFRYDSGTGKWYITNSKKVLNPQVYSISDINGYKLLENGTVVYEKKFGEETRKYPSPDYLEYGRLYSYRFFFDIKGLDDYLEIELVNDNANDVYPNTRLYNAYLEEAEVWVKAFDELLN